MSRLDSLTALRFFAALGVVVCHLRGDLPVSLTGFAYYLQLGVDLFFVLSGFVLTWSWRPNRTHRRFWWLRLARVWPLHMVTLLVAAALYREEVPVLGWLLSPFLLQNWVPQEAVYWSLNGVAWTLSVEAFFYLIFPVLVPMIAKLKVRSLLILSAACCVAMAIPTVTVRLFPELIRVESWLMLILPVSRLPQFVLGITLASLLVRGVLAPSRAWLLALVAVGGVVLAGGVLGLPLYIVTVLITPAVGALIWAVASEEKRRSWKVPRILVALGEWSFALYLTHMFVLYLLQPLASGWALVGVAIPAAIALSALAHIGLEQPVERRLRGIPLGTS